MRAGAADGLAFLGVRLDPERNDRAVQEEIRAEDSAVRVLVVEAREDLEIAGGVRLALSR